MYFQLESDTKMVLDQLEKDSNEIMNLLKKEKAERERDSNVIKERIDNERKELQVQIDFFRRRYISKQIFLFKLTGFDKQLNLSKTF
jgi:hypothetical protein